MRYALENDRSLTLTPNQGSASLRPVLGVGAAGEPGLPGPGAAAWTAAQAVTTGAVRQAPDGSWIKSTANRTTRASFDATEQTFWAAVLGTSGTIEQAAASAAVTTAVTTASTADRARANHTGTQPASTITGLGTAATVNTGTASGEIPLLSTGGRLPIARIASGTPTGSLFVRDDGTLAAPSGGGGTTTELLGRLSFQPAADVTTTSTTLVDVDATNLAISFTTPAGVTAVLMRLNGLAACSAAASYIWAVRNGTTRMGNEQTVLATAITAPGSVAILITGLTASTAYTFKWAHRVSTAATGRISQDFGLARCVMEVWSA